MENSYGIGVTNRFAPFLDDESDPIETLSLKEQERELKKKNKIVEKENKSKTEQPKGKAPAPVQKKPPKEPKPQEVKRDEQKPSQRPSAEGKPDRINKYNNENREERNNRRNREDKPYNGPVENRERDRENRPKRENFGGDNFETRNRDRVDRGERRNNTRGVGNRPGVARGGPRKPFDDKRKREFDRQSGSDKTGVKPIDKRDGAGAHNWGSHKDVIEEADNRPLTEPDQSWGETEKPEGAEPEKKEEAEEEKPPVEEEPKELTLDEWKAQRANRSKPQFNIRKAGEGEDPSQWKKMFELRKKEKEEESSDEEYDASEYPQRVGRQKHILDIDIQFNDKRRPGSGPGGMGRGRGGGPGGRGGGGGGRGGGGGGGPRGPRPDRVGANPGERPERRYREEQVAEETVDNRKAPKVDDERDFPSLG